MISVAQILLIVLSASCCIAAIAVCVGQRLRTVRRRMAVDLRPRSKGVLCDPDLGGWQPEGGGR